MRLFLTVALLLSTLNAAGSGLYENTYLLDHEVHSTKATGYFADGPVPPSQLEWPDCPAGHTVTSAGSGVIPPFEGQPFVDQNGAESLAEAECMLEAEEEFNCDNGSKPVANFDIVVNNCTVMDGLVTCEASCSFKWRCCKSPAPRAITF